MPEILQVKTKVPHPRRTLAEILGFILHSTGDKDEGKIVDYYVNSSKGVCPHGMINYAGLIREFCPIERVAYHTGYGEADDPDDQQQALYRQGLDVWTRRINKAPWKLKDPYSGYEDWKRRWPGLASPLDLVFGDRPNRRSIGIELQEPTDDMARRTPDHFTDAQYESLAWLIRRYHGAIGAPFPLDAAHVVDHYSCTPISRAKKSGGWDIGQRFNWARLFKSLA